MRSEISYKIKISEMELKMPILRHALEFPHKPLYEK